MSSRQYGFFYNHPGWGSVDFSQEKTTIWKATMSRQLDFLVTTSINNSLSISPYASILNQYYDSIGHATSLPDWALGFWASKNRYTSQTEIIDIVQNYTKHGINVSVLVIDWKHYKCVGDWGFSLDIPDCWPNISHMIGKLQSLGVHEVMVSLHPWSQRGSETYDKLIASELCVKTVNGSMRDWGGWQLPTCSGPAGPNCLYDSSNPAARQFLWSQLKKNYFAKGIKQFWTDGTEPAGAPNGGLPSDIIFHGNLPSPSSFMMWPVWHARTIYDGAIASGQKTNGTWSLSRSAWAGSHLSNAIVWSGDISSTWETLQHQLRAGLNFQLTYPYWNTDVGGYSHGNWTSPDMHELIVRWFQFSMFTSILRLHGARFPKMPNWIPMHKQCDPTGAANGPIEPWVYGDQSFNAIKQVISLRAKLKPYLKDRVAELSRDGQPIMRPLWFDFPQDLYALEVEDQFMWGPLYMVAPVVKKNATTRQVYFPGDNADQFKDYFTGIIYSGGHNATVSVTLTQFPFYSVIRVSK